MRKVLFGFALGVAATAGLAWARESWKTALAFPNEGTWLRADGMTMRQYAAIMAMRTTLEQNSGQVLGSAKHLEWAARQAWAMADAMAATE